MIRSSLNTILRLFQLEEEQSKEDVFNEAVLMTLARATSADSNIKNIEIETVQQNVKATTGEDVSIADVRVAANSHLYETASLERYLASAAKIMSTDQKISILNALISVIQSDERVTSKEIRFFNMVTHALDVTPADVLGLHLHP